MKILLVEDEEALTKQIREALESEGFTLDVANNGEDGQFLGETENYDAIILDLGLPIVDGVAVLRAWRLEDVSTPVLILTARGGWRDRVEGLNAGGDDYLGKPFHVEELVARLRALIRRSAGQSQPVLKTKNVELDTRTGKVHCAGVIMSFTANELKLLTTLMLRPDQVHTKAELAEQIYGYYEERDSNTIEVFVARIRRKLGSEFIRTIRGRGYGIGLGD